MKYLDYWEKKFDEMSSFDKKILALPILSLPVWIACGLIMPTVIIPIDWLFRGRKL